jgi:hypothetical protein
VYHFEDRATTAEYDASRAGASNRSARHHRAKHDAVLRGARIMMTTVTAAPTKAQPLRNLQRRTVGLQRNRGSRQPSSNDLYRLHYSARLPRPRSDGMPARDLI